MTFETRSADPRYAAARRILLDALVALAPHGDAFIIVGSQAIYRHTGNVNLDEVIAPFTTDGDLAVNPSLLGDDPRLEAAMQAAGFQLKRQAGGHVEPGIWIASAQVGDQIFDVPVDLIVPAGVAGAGGRRAARLAGHGDKVARRAVGLEAALVDHSPMTISALEPADDRSITAEIAGVAALFVAKSHKLHDRLASGRADRLSDKDAADVMRLMQSTSEITTGARLAALARHPTAGEATRSAVTYLRDMFGRRGAPGIEMAARAMQTGISASRVESISIAYLSGLGSAYAQEEARHDVARFEGVTGLLRPSRRRTSQSIDRVTETNARHL